MLDIKSENTDTECHKTPHPNWHKGLHGINCTLGWAEKYKNDIFKYADVDYYGTMYIKQGSIERNRIFKILAGCFNILKF